MNFLGKVSPHRSSLWRKGSVHFNLSAWNTGKNFINFSPFPNGCHDLAGASYPTQYTPEMRCRERDGRKQEHHQVTVTVTATDSLH